MTDTQKTVREALTSLVDQDEPDHGTEREAKIWFYAQSAQRLYRDLHDRMTEQVTTRAISGMWSLIPDLITAEHEAMLWTVAYEKGLRVGLRRAVETIRMEAQSSSRFSNMVAAEQRDAARSFLREVRWIGDLTDEEKEILVQGW